jgi:hypothetical protein
MGVFLFSVRPVLAGALDVRDGASMTAPSKVEGIEDGVVVDEGLFLG